MNAMALSLLALRGLITLIKLSLITYHSQILFNHVVVGKSQ